MGYMRFTPPPEWRPRPHDVSHNVPPRLMLISSARPRRSARSTPPACVQFLSV